MDEKARVNTARKLARKILKDSKIAAAPTPLQVVVKHLQKDYKLGVYSSENFSDALSGILVTVDDECGGVSTSEIHYNENHSRARQRFTIAHEIGHLLFNTTHSGVDKSYGNTSSVAEVEANQFASELLMPLNILKVDFKSCTNLAVLAKKYQVSEEALGWKIVNSRLG
jgi:hypothetical protein